MRVEFQIGSVCIIISEVKLIIKIATRLEAVTKDLKDQ
jgi:hypothetical protein